jgi:hypothetical protein
VAVSPSQIAASPSQLVPQTAAQLDQPAPSFATPPVAAAAAPFDAPPAPSAGSSALTWALRIGLVLLFVMGAVLAALFVPGEAEAPVAGPPSLPVIDVGQAPPTLPTPTPETQTAPTDRANAAEPTPAEPTPAEPIVHLTRVVSEPAVARVTREGADLGDTPLSLRIPEGEEWRLEVSAEGYVAQTVALIGGAQADVVVRLERARRAGSTSSTSASTTTATSTMSAEPEPSTDTTNGTIRDPWNR